MAKTNKKLPIHPFELVWYILCGGVGLWGLTYIVLGLVAQNLPITATDNDFVEANHKFAETFGLDWLGWGLIILAIAAVAAVIVLLACAGKSDREFEKNSRRSARLASILADEEETTEETPVVDVPVEEPKEETLTEE